MLARRRLARFALLLAGGSPAVALAQNQQAPVTTLPGLDNFTLTPSRPTPTPTPEPEPTIGPLRPAPAAPSPPPAPHPVPTPAPTPSASATPVAPPSATPVSAPSTGQPSPGAASPTPPISSAAPPPILGIPASITGEDAGNAWTWAALLVALVAASGGIWALLRRRPREKLAALPPPVAPSPVPAAVPTQAVPAPRPRLTLAFRPRRAGTTLTGAAVDYEVTVANVGDAPAAEVRVGLAILTAHAGQDADLKQLFAAPVEKPVTAPFALAPGETLTLDGMALVSFDRLNLLRGGGVDAFVPVIAMVAHYRWGELGEGRDAAAWLVGLERVDSAKLSAFRLDRGPRMFTEVAARAHGTGLAR